MTTHKKIDHEREANDPTYAKSVIPCPKCNQGNCPKCGGVGRVFPPRIDGSGYLSVPDYAGPACSGDGLCDYCGGEDFVAPAAQPLPDCKGATS